MRLIIPIAALLIAILSVSLDLFPPSLASPLCLHGACRFDQMFPAIDAAGATPEALSILVTADPANPMVWCTYAEALSQHGDTQKAQSIFDHAITLGPGMPGPRVMAWSKMDWAFCVSPCWLRASAYVHQTMGLAGSAVTRMERASGVAPAASIAGNIWSKRHAPWRHSGEAREGGRRARETERMAIRRAAIGMIRRMSAGPPERDRGEASRQASQPGH